MCAFPPNITSMYIFLCLYILLENATSLEYSLTIHDSNMSTQGLSFYMCIVLSLKFFSTVVFIWFWLNLNVLLNGACLNKHVQCSRHFLSLNRLLVCHCKITRILCPVSNQDCVSWKVCWPEALLFIFSCIFKTAIFTFYFPICWNYSRQNTHILYASKVIHKLFPYASHSWENGYTCIYSL